MTLPFFYLLMIIEKQNKLPLYHIYDSPNNLLKPVL